MCGLPEDLPPGGDPEQVLQSESYIISHFKYPPCTFTVFRSICLPEEFK